MTLEGIRGDRRNKSEAAPGLARRQCQQFINPRSCRLSAYTHLLLTYFLFAPILTPCLQDTLARSEERTLTTASAHIQTNHSRRPSDRS